MEKVKGFHEQKLIPSYGSNISFSQHNVFSDDFCFSRLVGYINSSYCRWFNKSGEKTTVWMARKTIVNNGISTTGSSTGELIPDFWLPSNSICDIQEETFESLGVFSNTLTCHSCSNVNTVIKRRDSVYLKTPLLSG